MSISHDTFWQECDCVASYTSLREIFFLMIKNPVDVCYRLLNYMLKARKSLTACELTEHFGLVYPSSNHYFLVRINCQVVNSFSLINQCSTTISLQKILLSAQLQYSCLCHHKTSGSLQQKAPLLSSLTSLDIPVQNNGNTGHTVANDYINNGNI